MYGGGRAVRWIASCNEDLLSSPEFQGLPATCSYWLLLGNPMGWMCFSAALIALAASIPHTQWPLHIPHPQDKDRLCPVIEHHTPSLTLRDPLWHSWAPHIWVCPPALPSEYWARFIRLIDVSSKSGGDIHYSYDSMSHLREGIFSLHFTRRQEITASQYRPQPAPGPFTAPPGTSQVSSDLTNLAGVSDTSSLLFMSCYFKNLQLHKQYMKEIASSVCFTDMMQELSRFIKHNLLLKGKLQKLLILTSQIQETFHS